MCKIVSVEAELFYISLSIVPLELSIIKYIKLWHNSLCGKCNCVKRFLFSLLNSSITFEKLLQLYTIAGIFITVMILLHQIFLSNY